MTTGAALCEKCSWYNEAIPLIDHSDVPCVCGGWFIKTIEGSKCAGCGSEITRLHIPAPDDLVIAVKVHDTISVESEISDL